jgi:hypothetical protein
MDVVAVTFRERAFRSIAVLLGVLAAVEIIYAAVLFATVPTFPLLDPQTDAETYATVSYATRASVRAWEAWPLAGCVAFFWVQVGGDVDAGVIARYNEWVPRFAGDVRGALGTTIVIAAAWLAAAAIGPRRREWSTRAGMIAVFASFLTTPVISEPVLGHDLSDLWIVWQLPGFVLAVAFTLLAPRRVPATVRAAAWSETRLGAVVWALCLVALSVGLSALAFVASSALGAASTVIATGPIIFAIRLVVTAFRKPRSVSRRS